MQENKHDVNTKTNFKKEIKIKYTYLPTEVSNGNNILKLNLPIMFYFE